MPAPIIYVDADASPVKAEVEKVAERHGVMVTFVPMAACVRRAIR